MSAIVATNKRRSAKAARSLSASDAFTCAVGRAVGHLTAVIRSATDGNLFAAKVYEGARQHAMRDMKFHWRRARKSLSGA